MGYLFIDIFIKKWADFVTNRRWIVLGATVVALVLLLLPIKRLYFDNSNEMWFLPGDIALVKYEQLRELFGSSQYLVIGIEARELKAPLRCVSSQAARLMLA